MTKMTVVMATSPIVHGKGTLPYRVELRAFYRPVEEGSDELRPIKFVVHDRVFDADKNLLSYTGGDYFDVTDRAFEEEAFRAAYHVFQQRSEQVMGYYPLATIEVANAYQTAVQGDDN